MKKTKMPKLATRVSSKRKAKVVNKAMGLAMLNAEIYSDEVAFYGDLSLVSVDELEERQSDEKK